jgi:hypothetical protein
VGLQSGFSPPFLFFSPFFFASHPRCQRVPRSTLSPGMWYRFVRYVFARLCWLAFCCFLTFALGSDEKSGPPQFLSRVSFLGPDPSLASRLSSARRIRPPRASRSLPPSTFFLSSPALSVHPRLVLASGSPHTYTPRQSPKFGISPTASYSTLSILRITARCILVAIFRLYTLSPSSAGRSRACLGHTKSPPQFVYNCGVSWFQKSW